MAPSTPAPELPAEACYPALLARDARFDGRWFVGVTSTGVYCRPICRVRTPKRENCRFFGSAAQAEAQAFRPCLKCRPELAPSVHANWTTMDASRTLARQAAALLDACDDSEFSLEQLAARLGITSRHLRRIFSAEHGVSPLQYLQTRRLLLAKHLLTDSSLPVSEVALAAGFNSLRRFNAAFLEHYRLQPTALRRAGGGEGSAPRLRLAYREPYDAAGVLAFLLPRAVTGVEQVDPQAQTVRRTVSLRHAGRQYAGWLAVEFGKRAGQVEVSLSPSLWPAVGSLLPLLRRWLDLDAEPQGIAAAVDGANPGLRLPGCLDRFELAVRAVLGQQVTVAAARTLAGRFVERFGTPLPESEGASAGADRLFPTAARMAEEPPERIAELGIIRRRADLIVELARRWPELAYARREGPIEAAIAELQTLKGLGPWTAHYMLMRGWSWPDAWLPGDVILKQRLAGRDPAAWQPYRSYAVLQLWRSTP